MLAEAEKESDKTKAQLKEKEEQLKKLNEKKDNKTELIVQDLGKSQGMVQQDNKTLAK
jgi:hypothetical protein